MKISKLNTANSMINITFGILLVIAFSCTQWLIFKQPHSQKRLSIICFCFLTTCVLFVVIETIVYFGISHRLTDILLIESADTIYSIGHWLFTYQYLKSALIIKAKLTQQKKPNQKTIKIVEIVVLGLVIISYGISTILEVKKFYNGTYLFGDSSQFLYCFWGVA